MQSAIEILGLDYRATEADIKASYRRLTQIYHPDRYHDQSSEIRQEAERFMMRLNLAYKELKDRNFLVQDPKAAHAHQRPAAQPTPAPRHDPHTSQGGNQRPGRPSPVEWRFGYEAPNIISLDSTLRIIPSCDLLTSALIARKALFDEPHPFEVRARLGQPLNRFPCTIRFVEHVGFTAMVICHSRSWRLYGSTSITQGEFGQAIRRLAKTMGVPANVLPRPNSII